MAKASRKRGKGKKANAVLERFLRPTPEREAHNDTQSAGAAVKIVAPITTLLKAGKINQRQFDGLERYAAVANAAERSLVKSNIDFSVYGTSEGLPHFGVRMNIELGKLELELHKYRLVPFVRAICVDELSVSQWAMQQGGSVMRCREEGRKVVRWYEPRRKFLDAAMLDLKYAGNVLAGAIGV